MLLDHDWKGNVRELENVIERAVLIADGPCVKPEHLLLESSAGNSQTTESLEVKSGSTVRQMEKKLIYKTLKEVDDNRTQAAELLGISIRTLRNKLHEYKAETSSAG
jgi:DNA-binding NtrC family response regulator